MHRTKIRTFQEDSILNILLTLDRNYLPALRVLLTSIFLNNPDEALDIYIAQDGFIPEDHDDIRALCTRFHAVYHSIDIDESWFKNAPTLRYYSRAMYYRLLAAQMLPETLDRILYLDPDMLVIGQLRPLYEVEMGDHLYAACIHRGLVDLSTPVNKIRLSTFENEGYFNSGMLLMNLPRIRNHVLPQVIFDYVRENRNLLVLPDQDVLNGLYGQHILALDEQLYNYDVRKYREYRLLSSGEHDKTWVMDNTVILHFCGKKKPWRTGYSGRFSMLYRHYMQLAARHASSPADQITHIRP